MANLDASVSDATNTGTVVASVSAGSFAARAAQTALDQWQKFGNQTYDIAGHATQIGHKEGEDAWHKYVGQYWKEGVGNDTLTGLDHSVPWSAAFVSWVMRTSGRWAQPPTQRKWLAEVKRCRIDGNGVDFGNLLAGITTIAAPVPDAAGKPTHTVGAAGIAEVMGLIATVGESLVAAARKAQEYRS